MNPTVPLGILILFCFVLFGRMAIPTVDSLTICRQYHQLKWLTHPPSLTMATTASSPVRHITRPPYKGRSKDTAREFRYHNDIHEDIALMLPLYGDPPYASSYMHYICLFSLACPIISGIMVPEGDIGSVKEGDSCRIIECNVRSWINRIPSLMASH